MLLPPRRLTRYIARSAASSSPCDVRPRSGNAASPALSVRPRRRRVESPATARWTRSTTTLRFHDRRLGHDDDKFVSPVPRQRVRGAADTAQDRCGPAERGVALQVPEPVVNPLEVVNLEFHDDTRNPVHRHAIDLRVENLPQRAPVEEPRQRIGLRLAEDLTHLAAQRRADERHQKEHRDVTE